MVCLPRANACVGGAARSGGSSTQCCRVPVQAVGGDSSGVHPAAPLGHSTPTALSCGLQAVRRDQPMLCPISYTASLQKDFLSLSEFFRGFSGYQSALTTLWRKPPVGRMLISTGRQGGAQLGSQSEANQETRAPPAPLCSCQETGRARHKPLLPPRLHFQPQLQAPHSATYQNRTALSLKFPTSNRILLPNCSTHSQVPMVCFQIALV